MHVTKNLVGSVAVLTLRGNLNAAAADLAGKEPGVLPAHSSVLIDLSEVTHLTSPGLRTLLLLYRQAQCLGSAVALVGLSGELRNAVEASGFLGFFRVADSVGEGVELLRSDRERADAS